MVRAGMATTGLGCTRPAQTSGARHHHLTGGEVGVQPGAADSASARVDAFDPSSTVLDVDGTADPGWRAIPPLAFVPYFGLRRVGQGPQLLALRAFWILIVGTVPLAGALAVLVVRMGVTKTLSEATGLIVSTVVGAASVSLVALHLRRSLRSTSVGLVDRYAADFYVRQAFGQAAAYSGLILSILSGSAWTYVPGAVFAVVAFGLNAPTCRRIARFGPEVLDDLMRPLNQQISIKSKPESGWAGFKRH